jgi:hypothetical protein
MSWQERERSVVSVSLISIDNYIPSMARRCIGKYVPGRGHGCSLTDQVLNKRQQRQAALASSSAHHQILTVFLLSKDMRGDGASHAHRSGTAARRRALCPASTNLTANRRPILRIRRYADFAWMVPEWDSQMNWQTALYLQPNRH